MAQGDRLSVTMVPEIGAAVRGATTREGTSVSNWLAAAAGQTHAPTSSAAISRRDRQERHRRGATAVRDQS